MATTYNPYSQIQEVYNAKVAWGNATTDEERKKQSDIANAARKKLEENGFGAIANQISGEGATAEKVKGILDSYNSYQPVTDVQQVYDAKVAWGNATTDEERQKQNEIANNARKNLQLYGYGDIANQISGEGADATKVKEILDGYTVKPTVETVEATKPKEVTANYTTKDYKADVDVQAVLDAKAGWMYATTDEEKQKYAELAAAARDRLIANGYEDIANQISAEGATATDTRKVLESLGPKPTDVELINKNNNEVNQYTNDLLKTQKNDREVMAGKYNKLEETAYANPFETAEGKAIIGKYDLKAMQGRENQLASGGATNGGNIDSFAAANALRQQAALTSQGQMMALEAHNNKINNVKGILESLGVYQQNQDKGMQNSISILQEEGQRLFENDQTAKNNEAARQELYSKISGKVGDTVTKLLNSNIWNADGSLVNPNSNNYQARMDELWEDYTSTTDETARARIWEQLRILEMARNQKIDEQGLNVPKTYDFQGSPQTEEGREFDGNQATVLKTLETDSADKRYVANSEAAASKYAQDSETNRNNTTLATQLQINNDKLANDWAIQESKNQNELNQIYAKGEVDKDLLAIKQSAESSTTAISDDYVPIVNSIMNQVNNEISKHKNGMGVTDAMKNAGKGSYTFTPPQYQPKAWAYIICNAIIDYNLPESQIGILLNQLGLTVDDFVKTVDQRNGK